MKGKGCGNIHVHVINVIIIPRRSTIIQNSHHNSVHCFPSTILKTAPLSLLITVCHFCDIPHHTSRVTRNAHRMIWYRRKYITTDR